MDLNNALKGLIQPAKADASAKPAKKIKVIDISKPKKAGK